MKFLLFATISIALYGGTYAFHADKVIDLPGLEGSSNLEMHAGLLPISRTDDKLFYFSISADESVKDPPIILWLQGNFHMNVTVVILNKAISIAPIKWFVTVLT